VTSSARKRCLPQLAWELLIVGISEGSAGAGATLSGDSPGAARENGRSTSKSIGCKLAQSGAPSEFSPALDGHSVQTASADALSACDTVRSCAAPVVTRKLQRAAHSEGSPEVTPSATASKIPIPVLRRIGFENTPPLRAIQRASAALSVGMGLVVNIHQLPNRGMRVFLRGGKRLVPQQLLNGPQIRAIRQQVRGKRMPQRVRM
jgi:hypothetical protein